MILTTFSPMMIMLEVRLMSSVYAFSDENNRILLCGTAHRRAWQCAQSNQVTKICYIGGSGLSSHTYDLFIGRIAEFREVCSFHARRDERKNTRFLPPSFEGCSISVRQKQEMSICAVSRQEKEEMWMRNEARNE